MHIVGTAGHVDHGKSSLVAALTGTNPDRWLEEQLRGMTLDLGFALLELDGGIEAGVVDVPGHERFLHNMLAGAAGMDVLLLTVAANEGVMPQTVEHLEILRFLNVRATIVALTKIDLVPHELRDEVRSRVAAQLRGSIAEGAPIAGVSSTSGEGLEQLRAEIASALRSLAPRDASAPAYLPIDRVFSLTGLGTIVTGTLMQGSIAVGDVVALAPSGLRSKVRAAQVFGRARGRVEAGARVALNLPSVDRHAIARGEAVVSPEFGARSSLRVHFTPLQAAVPLLRRRTPVRAYVGSAEVLGTLIFETVPDAQHSVRAELRLRQPVAAFPGVRFVLRRPSPKTLLGGGEIEALGETSAADDVLPHESAIAALLHDRGLEPSDAIAIALAANVREDVAQSALEALVERGEALRVRRPEAYAGGAVARELRERVVAALEQAHAAEPWALGVTSIGLSRVLGVAEPLLVRYVSEFAEAGQIVARSGYYSTLEHTPAFSGDQHRLFERLVPVDASAPLRPRAFDEAVAEVRKSAVTGASKAFDTLLSRGVFVKVGDELYRGSQIAQIGARVEEFLRRNGRMTAAQFRDLIGTSRKYAVPLLEWLDARGVTLRDGDYRTLRKKGA
ncbi:MAG TPA: selenocysteine-specific translation elongation factor [Candidatus Acidoferrales bacterium]|nr:selenocysteine-specific translation elongation factor [Candidatus Acidoferrales bacterium]